ncbi:MAG TPA: TlpA disulfide reductase family protein [Sphingomicrobium sp.]|nr:TlpA disulfide reductase family protein [Sphingomicrobium sp.]
MLLFLALLAIAGCDRQKPVGQQGGAQQGEAAEGVPAGPKRGIDRSHAGAGAPDSVFHDPDGEDITLSEFRGVPVLVNLWASWCVPCIKELPTLGKLEESHAVDGQLGVIAVSQDMAPKASVDAFLAQNHIGRYAAFHDPESHLMSALYAQVLPTSVLYDSHGREVWRYVGDLDWTSDEAKKLLSEAR